MNNYEEIQNMSIVELAYFLKGIANSRCNFNSDDEVLDWLREESALSVIRKSLGKE